MKLIMLMTLRPLVPSIVYTFNNFPVATYLKLLTAIVLNKEWIFNSIYI
jgi:hypothetical protein